MISSRNGVGENAHTHARRLGRAESIPAAFIAAKYYLDAVNICCRNFAAFLYYLKQWANGFALQGCVFYLKSKNERRILPLS